MADDVKSRTDISRTVEFICKDSKNTNKIHDLLKELEKGTEKEVINSAEILFQVFLFHVNEGTWKKRTATNNNSKPTTEARKANDTIALWLSSSYKAFIGLLSTKILNRQEENQCKMLNYFVDLINADFSFEMKNRDKPVKEAMQVYFPTDFNLLVKEIFFKDNFSNLSQNLSSVVQFADVAYYFLQIFVNTFSSVDKEIVTNIKTRELDNALKFLLLVSKNAESINGKNKKLHIHKFIEDKELCQKIALNVTKNYNAVFDKAWLLLLRQKNLTNMIRKNILVDLDSKIMPFLNDATMLIDFLTDSFDEGGVTSILALNGLFVLINKHNLDYPSFYDKLYTLIDATIFHMKYKARFFYLIDLFLSSTHLPAYMICAFVKKFSRMLLFTPAPDQILVLMLIKNMLIRHPGCRVLIHHKKVIFSGCSDPFDYEEKDPSKCNASKSSLWEVETLASHYSSEVKKCVASFRKNLPAAEADITQYFEQEFEDLFNSKIESNSTTTTTEKQPPFEFIKKNKLLEDLDSDMWTF